MAALLHIGSCKCRRYQDCVIFFLRLINRMCVIWNQKIHLEYKKCFRMSWSRGKVDSYFSERYLRLSEYTEINWNSALRYLILTRYQSHHPHIPAYSIWYIKAVTLLGTDQVRFFLTSGILSEPVFPCDMPIFRT